MNNPLLEKDIIDFVDFHRFDLEEGMRVGFLSDIATQNLGRHILLNFQVMLRG